MKHLKILGFAVIAAAALLAFAGSASATELTCGAAMCEKHIKIEAESEGHVVLDSPIATIECTSNLSGTTLNTGGPAETVEAEIEGLVFNNCTNGVRVRVLERVAAHPTGTLIVHTGPFKAPEVEINGTLTSTGTEVEVESGGIVCKYRTEATDIGTLTGSANTGATATLDIAARIPEVSGGFFCGVNASWTGSYKVTNPDFLDVD